MKDTISEEDMLMDMTKTEIERRLLKTESENKIFKENQEAYKTEMIQLKTLMRVYMDKLNQLEQIQLTK